MQVSCKASAHLIAAHTGRDAQERSSIIQGNVGGAIHKAMHVLWLSWSDHSCDIAGLLALALALCIFIWYFLTHHLQHVLNGRLAGSLCCISLASESRLLFDSGFMIHETRALTLVHFWTWPSKILSMWYIWRLITNCNPASVGLCLSLLIWCLCRGVCVGTITPTLSHILDAGDSWQHWEHRAFKTVNSHEVEGFNVREWAGVTCQNAGPYSRYASLHHQISQCLAEIHDWTACPGRVSLAHRIKASMLNQQDGISSHGLIELSNLHKQSMACI